VIKISARRSAAADVTDVLSVSILGSRVNRSDAKMARTALLRTHILAQHDWNEMHGRSLHERNVANRIEDCVTPTCGGAMGSLGPIARRGGRLLSTRRRDAIASTMIFPRLEIHFLWRRTEPSRQLLGYQEGNNQK
jgi:hypothetical protein